MGRAIRPTLLIHGRPEDNPEQVTRIRDAFSQETPVILFNAA